MWQAKEGLLGFSRTSRLHDCHDGAAASCPSLVSGTPRVMHHSSGDEKSRDELAIRAAINLSLEDILRWRPESDTKSRKSAGFVLVFHGAITLAIVCNQMCARMVLDLVPGKFACRILNLLACAHFPDITAIGLGALAWYSLELSRV